MLMGYSLGEVPVKVIVGQESQWFYVHSAALVKSSQLFQAALKTGWKEGQDREVTSEEERPDLFEFYAHWVYLRAVGRECLEYLAELYVLGEKLIDHTYQDDIANAMIAPFRREGVLGGRLKFPDAEDISTIYQNTPPTSPARRIVVDIYHYYGTAQWMVESDDENSVPFDREFLVDLSKALLGKKVEEVRQRLLDGAPCVYHKHSEDKKCGKEVLEKAKRELK